jgi:DNA-directed RNA polymerase specialized sigma24 family protein
LQLQALTGGAAYQKPEQLLERAGFAHKEIAEMLGKSPNAVTKTLIRAKAGTRN